MSAAFFGRTFVGKLTSWSLFSNAEMSLMSNDSAPVDVDNSSDDYAWENGDGDPPELWADSEPESDHGSVLAQASDTSAPPITTEELFGPRDPPAIEELFGPRHVLPPQPSSTRRKRRQQAPCTKVRTKKPRPKPATLQEDLHQGADDEAQAQAPCTKERTKKPRPKPATLQENLQPPYGASDHGWTGKAIADEEYWPDNMLPKKRRLSGKAPVNEFGNAAPFSVEDIEIEESQMQPIQIEESQMPTSDTPGDEDAAPTLTQSSCPDCDMPGHMCERCCQDAQVPHSPTRRYSEAAAERFGLCGEELRRLLRMRAPIIIYQILWFIHMSLGAGVSCDLDCVDYFAGIGGVARSFTDRMRKAVTFEILDDFELEDILKPLGMLKGCTYARKLRRRGLGHWGTVCSSFIWICRSVTKRSKESPLGDGSVKSVRDGNCMVVRMVLTLFIILARGALWLLEQPKSSVMHLHPRLALFMSRNPARRAHTSMGAYGAPSMKPSMLTGNVPFLLQLKKLPSENDRARFASHSVVDVDEFGAVTGRGSELKATQEYPIHYCEQVADSWAASLVTDNVVSDDSESEDGLYDENSDGWSDAGLSDLEDMMEVQHKVMPPGLHVLFARSRRQDVLFR